MSTLVLRRCQSNRLAELAGKRCLIAVAAVLRDGADRLVRQSQAAAGMFDPRAYQVLPNRNAEQRPHPQVELERRQPSESREIADPKRRIEMRVNMIDAARQAGSIGVCSRQRLQV